MVGIINYIVDPYDIFGNKLFNKYEYKDRISSSIKIERNKYDTLIIGTSRTQGGISTDNELFSKKNVLNASMSGSNVYEIHKVFKTIYENQNIGIDIIYGLDFLTFNDKRLPGSQFEQSLYSDHSKDKDLYLSILFSVDGLKDSAKTVLKTILGEKNYTINGYKDNNYRTDFNYKYAFEKILTNNFLVNDGTYGCYNYGIDRLNMFEEIIKKSKNRNLTLFITPLQYRHLMALNHLGLFEQYIDWIRNVHGIIKKYEKDDYNVKLYDFSYLNNVTGEDVSNNVEYFWESSHYKSKVGDMILDRIYNENENFGIYLNEENIDSYLKEYKNSYYSLFNKKQDEYMKIFNLYMDTTNTRINKCSKYSNIQTVLSREENYNPIDRLK